MPSSYKKNFEKKNRNNPDCVENVRQETTVEGLKALFGINILMDLNPLLQYRPFWQQNDFFGNSRVKKQ